MVRTVAELIIELQKLDPTAIVYGTEPPFSGVQVIPQVPSGDVMIASAPRQLPADKSRLAQGSARRDAA